MTWPMKATVGWDMTPCNSVLKGEARFARLRKLPLYTAKDKT